MYEAIRPQRLIYLQQIASVGLRLASPGAVLGQRRSGMHGPSASRHSKSGRSRLHDQLLTPPQWCASCSVCSGLGTLSSCIQCMSRHVSSLLTYLCLGGDQFGALWGVLVAGTVPVGKAKVGSPSWGVDSLLLASGGESIESFDVLAVELDDLQVGLDSCASGVRIIPGMVPCLDLRDGVTLLGRTMTPRLTW